MQDNSQDPKYPHKIDPIKNYNPFSLSEEDLNEFSNFQLDTTKFAQQEEEEKQDLAIQEAVEKQNKEVELYEGLDEKEDIHLANQLFTLKELKVPQEDLLSFKNKYKRLEELKGKRTSNKKIEDATKSFEDEMEKGLGWDSNIIGTGLNKLWQSGKQLVDELFTKDRESIEDDDIFDIPSYIQSNKLADLTDEETLEYYTLRDEIAEIRKPIVLAEQKKLDLEFQEVKNKKDSYGKRVMFSGVEIPVEDIKNTYGIEFTGEEDSWELNEKIIKIQSKYGASAVDKYSQNWRAKNSALTLAEDRLKKKQELLKNVEEGNLDFASGLWSMRKDLGTGGLHSLIQDGLTAKIAMKNPEERTEEDNQLLKAVALEQEIDSKGFTEDRFSYGTGQGLGHTLVFMENMMISGGATGAVSGTVKSLASKIPLKILLKESGEKLTQEQLKRIAKIKVLEKGFVKAGELATQPLSMVTTYGAAAEKLIGQVELVKALDENGKETEYILSNIHDRKKFEKEAENSLNRIDKQLLEFNSLIEENENLISEEEHITFKDKISKEIQKLENQKAKINQDLSKIYNPEGKSEKQIIEDIGLEQAFMYGYLENLKEIVAETVGGNFIGKGFKSLKQGIAKSSVYNKYMQSNFSRKYISPVGNAINTVDDLLGQGKDFINDKFVDGTQFGRLSKNAMYHTGVGKIWHGLPSEFVEEIAVQLTPTYGEDYSKQLDELTNPEFYAQVGLSVALLGGAFTGVSKTSEAYNYLTNDDYRKQVKKAKDFKKRTIETYQELDASITDDQVANRILMATGGTLFDVLDYNKEIEQLRKEGKDDEADKIESTSFLNIAHKAVESNTIDRFRRTLRRMATNTDLSQSTRDNAVKSLSYIPVLKKIKEDNKEYLNQKELFILEMNNVFAPKTMREADAKINKIKKEADEELENWKTLNEGYEDFTLDNLFDKENTNEYKDFVNKILKEDLSKVKELINLKKVKVDAQEANAKNREKLKNLKSKEYQETLKRILKAKQSKEIKDTTTSENVEQKKESLVKADNASGENIAAANEGAVTSVLKKSPTKTKATKKDYEGALSGKDLFDEDVTEDIPVKKPNVSTIPDNQSLFQPATVNENNPSHKKIINNIAQLFKNLDAKGLLNSFGDVTATMKDYHSSATVERNFNLIRKAYEIASGEKLSEKEFQDTYNSLYPYGQSGVTGNEFAGTDEVDSNIIEETDKSTDTKNIEYDPISKEVVEIEEVISIEGEKRYADIGLKIGVLGRNYEGRADEEIITISNTVNENAKPYIDPRNFKVGDEVEFVFDINYLLKEDNDINIWEAVNEEKPYKNLVSTKEFLINLFKDEFTYEEVLNLLIEYQETKKPNALFNNQEFLKQIPVGLENKGYKDGVEVLPGALNSYYWFNNMNIALKKNIKTGEPSQEERQYRIDANRKINYEARKTILNKGSFKATISKNQDKETNTRILKTPEEKSQKYPNQFYSLTSQFNNDVNEFNKNASIGYIDKQFDIIGKRDNNEKPLPIKVDGVEIKKESIENWNNFITSLKKGKMKAGQSVFIHKTGFDKDGNQLYVIRQVLNNHKSKQAEFKRVQGMVFDLARDLGFTEKHVNNINSEKAINIKKAFKNKLGIDLNEHIFKYLKQLYPKGRDNNYRQDYSDFAHSTVGLESIPDLKQFASYNDFLKELLTAGEIPMIDRTQAYLDNIHTNLVFTPITKNGETIYTTDSQPFIKFESNLDTEFTEEDVNEDLKSDKKRLENKKEFLEVKEKESTNEAEKKELKEQIKETEKDLKKVEGQLDNIIEKKEEIVDKQSEIDKIEAERQIELNYNKPFKQKNDNSGLVTVETKTTEKEGILKTKFKTKTANKKGEAREQNNKGYNSFEEAVQDLNIDLASEENESALELYETVKKSQEKENIPVRVTEIRESTDKSSPFYGMRTATISLPGGYKIEFRLKSKKEINAKYDAKIAALENKTEKNVEPVFQSEIEYLENQVNKDEILGVVEYEDSIREYLDLQLSLTEFDNDVKALLYQRAEEEYNNLIKDLKKAETGESQEISKDVIVQEIVHRTLQHTFNTVKDLKFNEKDYEKSSYEIDITKSISFQTKMMLSNIKDSRKGKVFADMKQNLSLPEVFEALHQILSELDNNTLEDIKTVSEAFVKKNPSKNKFYYDIYKRLEEVNETNPEIINEILYNLYQPKLDMNFVMWSMNNNGEIVIDKYDANAKNPLFVKKFKWLQNLKSSGLLDLYEGQFYKVNEEKYNKVVSLYDTITKAFNKENNISQVEEKDLKEFLNLFGVRLDQKIYDDLFIGKDDVVGSLKDTLFREKTGFIDKLKANLEEAKKSKKKLSFDKVVDKTKEKRFNLLDNDNSQYNDIVKLDNIVSAELSMNTMHIGGKTIYMYQQPNSILNTIKNLKKSVKAGSGHLQDLLESPMTSNSMLLKLLKENPDMFDYFGSFTMSLEAIKEMGSKSQSDKGITNLSDKDAFLTLLGMFSATEGSIKDLSLKTKNIKLRKGSMSFPTISDASQLPMLKTFLIELSKENYNENTDTLSDNILEILQEQLLISDLKRIGDYMIKVEDSNIEFYDKGAVWITGIPSLNTLTLKVKNESSGEFVNRAFLDLFRSEIENIQTLKIKIEENGKTLERDATIEEKEKAVANKISEITSQYQKEIYKEINDNISHEADKLISKDGKQGQFVKFELVDEKGDLKIGSSKKENYFKDKTARQVAVDYMVNYMLQQKEIQTIFAGDIAGYFKTKKEFKFKHHLPVVTKQDVEAYGDLSLLKYIDENLGDEENRKINHEEIYNALLPVIKQKTFKVFKEVQNNVSKRLKELVSPGSQFPNSQNSPNYYQLMVKDIENASKTLDYLIAVHYPKVFKDKAFMEKVREFKIIDEQYDKNSEEKRNHKKLLKEIEERIPQISAYLETASTDAQEYVTWQDNLEQLLSQGRIIKTDYVILKDKFEKQEKDLEKQGFISDENRLTPEEHSKAMMQPSKPLYSGLHIEDINGHKASRYVYIKSSSFPITPEIAEKFPDLYTASKKMQLLGKEVNGKVRVSYGSANKVGGVSNPISISDFYKGENNIEEIKKSSVLLNPKNFYIQQDKPYKGDKNAKAGKRDEVRVATQFEKIILGDGINKINKSIFPANMFDKSLLKDLDIESENNMINGPALKRIYNEISKRQQKVLSEKLFDELGIETFADISLGNPSVMEKLSQFLNNRITNKQDKQALELLYTTSEGEVFTKKELQNLDRDVEVVKAEFRIPLFMSPNSRKFESVMNSIINNNNIRQKMNGFSSPVASEQGFDYRNFGEIIENETEEEARNRDLQDLKEKGLITTPEFDPNMGLKSERDENGVLKYAQVFAPNRLKYFDSETKTYKEIQMKNYIDENTGQLDFSKFPQEILSMFSYRIPTSAHQSGTIIEVVGFLPKNAGDLLIVPKDHTVQIGEDYDIDIRFMYNYNIVKDGDNIKVMNYEDIKEKPNKTSNELWNEYQGHLNELWNEYYKLDDNKNPLAKRVVLKDSNLVKLSAVAFLEQEGNNRGKLVDSMVASIFGEEYINNTLNTEELIRKIENSLTTNYKRKQEYRSFKNLLKEAWKNEDSSLNKSWTEYNIAKNNKVSEQYILENNLISMYKSVFGSPDKEVRQLITKVLSTKFSEDSANIIDNKKQEPEDFYNMYSPFTQRDVMKLGADGKLGIAQHSNAVTFNSILQQLDEPLHFYNFITEDGDIIPYNIKLGNLVFDGKLGKIYDKSGRRISEYIMESQNSATDNQKLQIMGKRNENPETMAIFSLLQMSGLENDLLKVEGESVSYASLFIAQDILNKYTDLQKTFKSSTNKTFGKIDDLVYDALFKEYAKNVPKSMWQTDEDGDPMVGTFSNASKEDIGKKLTSQKLYDSINSKEGEVDYASQWYVFQNFLEFKGLSRDLTDLQQFTNIESGGLGISYFNTIELKNKLNRINSLKIVPQSKTNEEDENSLFKVMFGEANYNVRPEDIKSKKEEGYVFIADVGNNKNLMVKPNNHYSHKIMNSVSLGYNMWNSIFPYDNPVIKEQIDNILHSMSIEENTKAGMDLKYKIISSMKDYVYSNNRGLFNNVFTIQNELFFNTEVNESLGSYLKRLENSNEYSYLFQEAFFKDLKIQVNDKNHPTTISFDSGDISPEYNARINNYLKKLMNSDKILPDYNGKTMTESELVKNLLSYSLVADQANGATGFRRLFPLDLLEKYGVNKNLRDRSNPLNKIEQNIIYNGLEKSLESLLGSVMNEDGFVEYKNKITYNNVKYELQKLSQQERDNYLGDRKIENLSEEELYQIANYLNNSKLERIVNRLNILVGNNRYQIVENGIQDTNSNSIINMSTFERQFIQHNLESLRGVINYNTDSKTDFMKLLKENNLTLKEFNENPVNDFNTYMFSDKYLVLKDIKGEKRLYEKQKTVTVAGDKDLNVYKRITVLGTNGFNEYNVGRKVDKSKVNNNNFNQNIENKNIIDGKAKALQLNTSSLKVLLDNIMSDKNNKYYSLMSVFREFVIGENDVQVSVVSDLPGNASYQVVDGQPIIKVSQKFLDKESTTEQTVQQALMEEVLHHITMSTTRKYGEFVIENNKVVFKAIEGVQTPSQLLTLTSIYNEALKHYVKKYGDSEISNILERFKKRDSSLVLNEGIEMDGYRLSNFHEFIAGIFLDTGEFKNEMSKTIYKNSNKNILEKFADTIARFFVRILPNAKKRSIGTNVFNELYSFLKETVPPQNNTFNNKETIDKKPDSDAVKNAEKIVDKKIKNQNNNITPLKNQELFNPTNQVNNLPELECE